MVVLAVGWLVVRSHLTAEPMTAAIWGTIAAAIVAGAACALAPDRWAARAGIGLARLAATDGRATAFVAVAAVVVGVFAAWVQRPYSWDEPLVVSSARIVADEGIGAFFARYASIPWLGTNHPPLVVLVFGLAMRLAGPDLLPLRLLAVLVGVGTTVACLAIARRLVDREAALLAPLVLLSSPLFDRMLSAAMNDVFVTFCFTWAVLLTMRLGDLPGSAPGAEDARPERATSTIETRRAVLLGLVLGTGLLVKYTMILVYPVLAAILLVQGTLAARWRACAIALGISGAIFGAWLMVAWNLEVLGPQVEWTARMGGVATRSARGFRFALDALFTKLPSGLGLYNLPLLALGLARFATLPPRSRRVLAGWIVLVSVPLLSTLPDNRYFLPVYPAFAILSAVGIVQVAHPGRARVLALAWLLCGVTLAYYTTVDLRQRAFLFRYLFAP
jgi:4-amino-4-deoxy-L-arabinose transferase-like glycosyltransferase